jgi:hypothetical protein
MGRTSATAPAFLDAVVVEPLLDDDAAPGKQQCDALSVRLEQSRQISLDLLQRGTGGQLPGKGDFVAAHGYFLCSGKSLAKRSQQCVDITFFQSPVGFADAL